MTSKEAGVYMYKIKFFTHVSDKTYDNEEAAKATMDSLKELFGEENIKLMKEEE